MTKQHRWIAGSPAQKHVIFLGAGASHNSGYPLANELTLLMCDQRKFQTKLRDVFEFDGDGSRGFERNSVISQYYAQTMKMAVELLRFGDFTTMDELSKYAVGGKHSGIIRDLKKLMRLMLSLHNPDFENYASSDYRRLIQKLFVNDSLRQDVSIISYNYDPYLEFRLYRAFQHRLEVRPPKTSPDPSVANSIHSGFLKHNDLSWLQHAGFCHLKLHGVCAFPSARHKGPLRLPMPSHSADEFHAGYLFAFPAFPRLSSLCQPPFSEQDPPAFLPWEIVHEGDSRLLTKEEFVSTVGETWQHSGLHPLLTGIWERARREVQVADKISFVGLSLGSYLEPGLRYLFEGKSGSVQFVIANPDNDRFKDHENQMHSNSPAGRAYEMLNTRCGMQCQVFGSFSEYAGFNEKDYDVANHEPTVTRHNSFRSFIEAEM